MSRVFVFLGPTLTAAEASMHTTANILPPARLGDVHDAVTRQGARAIGLVDGLFNSVPAVWHKELLFALSRGVRVFGAASMGALRAAELAPFGMIGVGTIYRAYAAGRLGADDEVAVAHLPAEYGYAATSDALVDLRDGLARAKITERTRAGLIELARAPEALRADDR